jgi:RecA/RadA recombinase
MIGQLHQDDSDAIAIKFNTEMRELGQLTPEQAKVWGIDRARYVCYDVNRPDLIFDRIEKDIAAMCQEGAPIRLVVIDSVTAIQGRRSMNADTIMTQQIGDLALTLTEGLKRILPVQRKYRIALVLTAHIRAEMDPQEQMRGNKVKMAASFGLQHHAEYFMFVEPNKAKAGRTDLLGQELVDETVTDLMDKGERLAHKIRVHMKDSSMGPKGRTGEFTLDYHKGIINTHEEVFLLGVNRNIVERPNAQTYVFGTKKWAGKPAFLQALKDDPELCNAIITELKRRDLAGSLADDPAPAEESA